MASIYRKGCAVCQYMKRHKDFREKILMTSYITPESNYSINDVIRQFKAPFTYPAIVTHFRRHEPHLKDSPIDKLNNTVAVIEAGEDKAHIKGLDDFIAEGRKKLARGELVITSTNYLQAIKIKSDDEKANKDRKVDLLRTMFAGAGPKTDNDRVDATTEG